MSGIEPESWQGNQLNPCSPQLGAHSAILHLTTRPITDNDGMRSHVALLRSFPHVSVLPAPRALVPVTLSGVPPLVSIGTVPQRWLRLPEAGLSSIACLSRPSELFLNNCRVVSASLME
ncbi:hypothetical protein [Kosakonia radicincitans]|uniref:hypothetical protein n=1 Tax=Kosakonia radicincitans TaxID=283686 RepID=UPI000272DF21|nr:hypothetical protein [Kosakonia radicincitans]